MATGTYEGVWKNRETGETVSGTYRWNRSAESWVVWLTLPTPCKYTGDEILFIRSNAEDNPDFGKWFLQTNRFEPNVKKKANKNK